MSDRIDYPPSQSYELGVALEEADEESNTHDGLAWAVHGDDYEGGFDGWGEDAEITLEALTADIRGTVVETLKRTRVGEVGDQTLRKWLIGAAVVDAPFVESGDDLETKADVVGQLPPALFDWIDSQLEELNDLSEGN